MSLSFIIIQNIFMLLPGKYDEKQKGVTGLKGIYELYIIRKT